jgi:acetyltransferase-like isoleucine patch superfamily enzyme
MKRMLLIVFYPARWYRVLKLLSHRVRAHPTALLLGRPDQLRFDKNVKVGRRVIIDPENEGIVILRTGVWISSEVEMQTSSFLTIGNGTTIQRRCTINGTVNVGRGCILAPNVFISSGTHPFRSVPYLPIREQEKRLAEAKQERAGLDRPVIIQDDCWLGTNVVICPGVTIAKGSVVGANAVVTRDVPPYCVVAGNPANVIGKRLDWEPKLAIDVSLEEDHPYILDGLLERTELGYIVALSDTSSLVAALCAPSNAFNIAINWRSSTSFSWIIGHREVHQEPGVGRLLIPSHELSIIDDIVYCTLRVKDLGGRFFSVEISHIFVE